MLPAFVDEPGVGCARLWLLSNETQARSVRVNIISISEAPGLAVAAEDMLGQLVRGPGALHAELGLLDQLDDGGVDRRPLAERLRQLHNLAVQEVDLGRATGGEIVGHRTPALRV